MISNRFCKMNNKLHSEADLQDSDVLFWNWHVVVWTQETALKFKFIPPRHLKTPWRVIWLWGTKGDFTAITRNKKHGGSSSPHLSVHLLTWKVDCVILVFMGVRMCMCVAVLFYFHSRVTAKTKNPVHMAALDTCSSNKVEPADVHLHTGLKMCFIIKYLNMQVFRIQIVHNFTSHIIHNDKKWTFSLIKTK